MKWSLASVYCLSHILSQLKSFTLEGKAVGHEAGQSSSLYFTAVLWSTHRLVRYKCSHSLRMTSYCRILLKARLLNKTSHPIYPSPPSYFLLCFLPLIPSVSLQFFFLWSFTLLLICINHVSPSPLITVQLYMYMSSLPLPCIPLLTSSPALSFISLLALRLQT